MKLTYERYCEDCKKFKMENPYKSEFDFNRAYGIDQHKEPLVLTPRNQKRPMKATFENSDKSVVKKYLTTPKELQPKKPKELKGPKPPKTDRKMSPKIVLKLLTPEERRERKNTQSRLWRAKQREKMKALKEQGIKPEVDPQKAQRLREEALARYHKKKPPRVRVFYKDLTPEEIVQRKKEAKKRYHEKAKAEGRTYNRKKPQTPEEIAEQREWKRLYAHRPDQVAKRKAYREANKQKLLEYNKEWIGKNPQKRKLHQDKADAKRRGAKNNTCILQEAS